MVTQRTNVFNAFEVQLAEEFGPTDLTIVTASMGTQRPAVPCFLVLDPLSENAGREYILFDSASTDTSYTTSVLENRYQAGSSASGGLTHPAGTLVRMSPLMQHFDEVHARIDQRLTIAAHTRSAHEDLGISHASLTGLNQGDPHPQYLTSGRHSELSHPGQIAVSPTGVRLAVSTSPPSSPSPNDLWVDLSA